MIYSPWGNYVPLGDSQYGTSPYGPGGSGSPQQSPGGGGGGGVSPYASPEAISAYGNIATGIFGAITGRGAPPPVTTPPAGGGPPLLLIGAGLVAAFLIFRALRKRT